MRARISFHLFREHATSVLIWGACGAICLALSLIWVWLTGDERLRPPGWNCRFLDEASRSGKCYPAQGWQAIREGLTALLSTRELEHGYCRVTRYLGSRTIDNPREPDGVFVALYSSPPLFGKPVKCITSAWRRNELVLPSQTKIGGHYFLLSWLRC
jgi:hypothetical protein